jgi:hypothetical protein
MNSKPIQHRASRIRTSLIAGLIAATLGATLLPTQPAQAGLLGGILTSALRRHLPLGKRVLSLDCRKIGSRSIDEERAKFVPEVPT